MMLLLLASGDTAFGSFTSSEEKCHRDVETLVVKKILSNANSSNQGSMKKKPWPFAAEDAAAAELVAQLLSEDPELRPASCKPDWAYAMLKHRFFDISVAKYVEGIEADDDDDDATVVDGETTTTMTNQRTKLKFDVKNVSKWTVREWSALARHVISSYEDVE